MQAARRGERPKREPLMTGSQQEILTAEEQWERFLAPEKQICAHTFLGIRESNPKIQIWAVTSSVLFCCIHKSLYIQSLVIWRLWLNRDQYCSSRVTGCEAERKQQVASTQYGSKMIHLFLDTDPGSQHIINHSTFIYLHLCFPSESVGGAFLICLVRIP